MVIAWSRSGVRVPEETGNGRGSNALPLQFPQSHFHRPSRDDVHAKQESFLSVALNGAIIDHLLRPRVLSSSQGMTRMVPVLKADGYNRDHRFKTPGQHRTDNAPASPQADDDFRNVAICCHLIIETRHPSFDGPPRKPAKFGAKPGHRTQACRNKNCQRCKNVGDDLEGSHVPTPFTSLVAHRHGKIELSQQLQL